MLIFGTNGKVLKQELGANVKCGNCGQVNTTQLIVIGNYAHLYYIPFFATGKTGKTFCAHCKYVCNENQLGPELKALIKDAKKRSAIPVWFFTFFIVAPTVVFLIIFSWNRWKDQKARLISEPQIGMKITIKAGKEEYMRAQLNRIEGDSLFFNLNKFTSNRESGFNKIDTPENYTDLEIIFLKSDLKEKYNKDEITDVDK